MKTKKILGFIQIVGLFLLLFGLFPKTVKAASAVGLGDIGYTESRDIDDDVALEYVMGTNNNGEQKAYTVEIAQGALLPAATYGTYVNGGEKLTSMLAMEEMNTGKKVVAAINGDFYDTSNGIPSAIMIVNGRFVTSGTGFNSRSAIGIKADGSVVYGRPSISIKLNDGNDDITINYLNNDRKYNETSLYLYTSDYGATTKTTNPGKEIRLNIESGDLLLGSDITATVESTDTHNMPIGENQIVLSCAAAQADKLSALTVGKTVTISLIDNKPAAGWSEVVQAIGYNVVLAENGVLTPVTESDTAIHPRSAIGLKEDGSIVLFQVDGRQPGWSNGLSYKQIAQHLVNEKDCKTVFNLDGGGSSTLMVRLPGKETAEILNSPSDGVERSNSNALLFFSEKEPDPDKTLSYLHTYPNNLVILEGAKTQIDIKATDINYYPVSVPNGLEYEISGNIGTIDTNGMFSAKSGTGQGQITVKSGDVSQTLNVTVVDSVTNIIADKTYLSVSPGETVEFNISAFKDGMPITASNSSFTWQLSTPVLGSIEDGVFTGTSGSAAGYIYISYKDFELEIPVEVGKQPDMISTFEDAVIGDNWRQTIENPGNGGTGTVSVNTDERFVKFGEKSLRIDYDFTKAVGTTSVTAHFNTTYFNLDGYPTHIGMWVYGDMNGANIRTMVYDGNNSVQYLAFIPDIVTWDGWQYIEAEIPAGLPTPIKIRYPIRVMSVGGNVKTAGTLYFDNIRAVYGFRNDDESAPITADIAPQDGTVVDNLQPSISLKVWDEPDAAGILTGINKDSIKLWLNEELMDNVLLNDNPDGTITVNYTPSALNKLRPGPQVVKLRVEDNYGNITIKNWQFFVAGDYVGIDAIVPPNDMIFAGDVFSYVITASTYQNFEKFEGTMTFNNKALEILSVAKVDSAITFGIVDITAANQSGQLDLLALGMDKLSQPAHQQLIRITFRTKDGFRGNSDSAIIFKNVKVKETVYDTPNVCMLPSYEVKVNYRYILTYITSTVGRDITFKVTDIDMNPVEGASFIVEGESIALTGRTGPDGTATFDEFKHLVAGGSFKIYAIKGSYFSEKLTVTMVNSLGSAQPYNIVVGPGEDASESVNISWQTDIATEGTVGRYRKVGTDQWYTVTTGTIKDIHVVSGVDMREYLAHAITFDGLQADTEYEYQVGADFNDDTKMSPLLTFKTVPAGDISFLFLGDPQNTSESGYQITKDLIDAAMFEHPDLSAMLIAGDVVDDANIYAQWQAFEAVIGPYVNSMITVAASGNHDVIRNYGDPFAYTFVGPQNGVETLGVCFYVEAGNAAIAVIDTETPAVFDEQAEWLLGKMATTEKQFKIVLMHRSPYAANYNEPHIRDFWPAVFDQAAVDLVLSGHDHVYNSTTMFDGQKTSLPYGITYVVGGSAGSKFYNANNLDERYWIDYLYDDDNPVFSTIDLIGQKLTLKSYALTAGVTTEINQIIIDKSINKAETIEIENPVPLMRPGAEHEFSAVLKDGAGAAFPGEITYRLANEVEGITVSTDGKLTIDADFNQNTEIEIILSYESVREVLKVFIFGNPPTPSAALAELMARQNNFIGEIFR